MSQRDFSEVEPEGTSELPAASRTVFLEKVRLSNAACQNGDFATAVSLYTDALQLDPTNHILYSNRSAARLKQGQFSQALQDAIRARELCPTWPKAYYRQGVALQCLGRHGEALAAFSAGLAQDPSSQQLLAGLVEASIKSPLRNTLEPTFLQLQAMKLDQSPFVVISVVGQELLAAGLYHSAVTVLESALRIGSCSLKLRGSVFSALSSAHWALNQLDKAIAYMQQDLAIAKSLGDTIGECRAHGNLGSAYFSQGSYKEALTAHRYQLVLAMKCKDTQAAATALTSLGHVYTAIGDYPNALASHKQCVQLVKQIGDRLQEAREIGNVGAVYLAMGDFDSAVDCHTQHLRIARRLGNQVEEARAYSNLGSSHHYRRNFAQATAFHENVLRLAQQIGDKAVEARAYAGLGHAARCAGDHQAAKKWHERQLDIALATRDKVGEGRACSNLGIVYQLLGEYDSALKLHQMHLSIARSLGDKAGMGRAYGNIGNAYSAAGFYESAIKYHKQELTISKEVHDRNSEASTHGNLAVAYQALGIHDMALLHYKAHLGIARELKDTAGEACALLNLGNCLSSRSEFAEAIPYYEQYLMLSQELADVEGEAKACHFLGYAHYCIGNYREAVRYYDQDLALAKDLQDKMNMGRAYCNLGLAHLALGQLETSLECQKYFLAIAHMTQNVSGKFRALGNIGDILIKQSNIEEAIKMYQRQLALARSTRDRSMESAACGALGLANRVLRRFDKALGFHTQELTLRQEMGDMGGECKAHGNLGAVHMALGNYTHAVKCYQEQLERAQDLQDCSIEAQAYGNLGIARLNMGHYEDAIGYFEQQLATLERLSTPTSHLDRGRAFGSLGDCYFSLNDPEEAAKCHEQHLAIALKLKSVRDQERAYSGLGQAMKAMGNLQQALVCLEKRLVVAHEGGSEERKAAAYGELGQLHATLGNLEQAISCLDHQQTIARDLGDIVMEAEAASGLGCVYQQMSEHSAALRHHQQDLELAERLGLPQLQGRACGNLGAVHEALGNYEQAIRYQEQHLSVAASTNDQLAKTLAYSSLGRIHQLLGNKNQAIAYLTQGLCIAETLSRRDEEAKIRNRLGLALYANGDLEGAYKQLEAATHLLETIRRENKNSPDYKLSLFELQSSSYQILQRVLIALNRHEDALVVAERGKTRAFVDLLLERQGYQSDSPYRNFQKSKNSNLNSSNSKLDDLNGGINNLDQLLEIVNRQRATILYYSLAAGYLYSWLIVPNKGVVRFNEICLSESPSDSNEDTLDPLPTSTGILERLVQAVRDSLGTELGPTNDRSSNSVNSDDQWSSNASIVDEINERNGFLRMVNRNHLLNSSNYSLSSLFSLGSVNGSVASLQGSTRSSASVKGGASNKGVTASSLKADSVSSGSTRGRKKLAPPQWQGPSCLHSLYKMLIGPFDDWLMEGGKIGGGNNGTIKSTKENTTTNSSGKRELILVLEADLYLVPFSVLRSGAEDCNYLCEKFSLLAVPSLHALRQNSNLYKKKKEDNSNNNVTALVVGNPKLPPTITDHWGWSNIPQAEQEANMVAELLQTNALVGMQASKQALLEKIQEAECVHLATHISWKLSSLVLSPIEMLEQGQPKRYYTDSNSDDDSASLSTSVELPPLSDFLLSAADLLSFRLSARLVVLSSSYTRDSSDQERQGYGFANSEGLIALVRAFLAAGAQAVLVSLWPVPDTATKILLRAFYSALLQGTRAARALAEAMQTVQHTKHFAHPANWAGFLLIGANTRLSNKVALMGQALCELLRGPDKCRDALRVTLHLVEKSLQRIHRGQKNAMYTTQKSIENKVGNATGWKELLMSVGFRFEPAANGIPSSVFFPQSDPDERLTQCSASLQALLGLSSISLHALSKLTTNSEVVDDIITVIQQILTQLNTKSQDIQTPNTTSQITNNNLIATNSQNTNTINSQRGDTSSNSSCDYQNSAEVTIGVRLWRVPGCHELFASLGLDLVDVGQDKVTLRTGKQANKRHVQFVLQALLALFDTQEAPKSLSIDSSSSLESLASVDNDFSHSDNELDGKSTIRHQKTTGSANKSFLRGPVPFARSIISGKRLGGAFQSYVRHRGEPDGRTSQNNDNTTILPHHNQLHKVYLQPRFSQNQNQNYTPINQQMETSNTTGLYLSNTGTPKTTPLISHGTLNPHPVSQFVSKQVQSINKNSLKQMQRTSTLPLVTSATRKQNATVIGRPGGGGESDAAFTPSPPVVSSNTNSGNNSHEVSLNLIHQNRIKSLYSNTDNNISKNVSSALTNDKPRPDSSSSASSATDWETTGHATVLRRHNLTTLPPIPPPRIGSTAPLTDLKTITNSTASTGGSTSNMGGACGFVGGSAKIVGVPSGFDTSSDSELEKMEGMYHTGSSRRDTKNSVGKTAFKKDIRNLSTLDRLSVRTEVTPGHNNNSNNNSGSSQSSNIAIRKQPINLQESSNLGPNNQLLYYSTSSSDNILLDSTLKQNNPKSIETNIEINNSEGIISKLEQEISGKSEITTKNNNGVVNQNTNSNTLHDTIIQTQLRHINRELTPSISEVYHERNIGLGLAPPLSKLLLNHQTTGNQLENNSSILEKFDKLKINLIDDYRDIENQDLCQKCQKPENACNCPKNKSKLRPWLTDPNSTNLQDPIKIQSSDLTTADLLEREIKNKKSNISISKSSKDPANNLENDSKRLSPLFEFCKRDEADGRSIADSQCSSSYNKRSMIYSRNDSQITDNLKNDSQNNYDKTLPSTSKLRNK